MSIAAAVRQTGVPLNMFCRWRRQYGGMSRAHLKRLKELESEAANAVGLRETPNNLRLRRAVSDLTPDSEAFKPPPVRGERRTILSEAAQGNC